VLRWSGLIVLFLAGLGLMVPAVPGQAVVDRLAAWPH
jgi:hypothetical protein